MKIGYQGINGAFSSIASRVLAPNASEYIGFSYFWDVFKALEDGVFYFEVIPIEISYAGRVADVLNIITKRNVWFCAEYILKIEHNLLVKKGAKLADITEVHSHEQAIMQSQANLNKIFEGKTVKFVRMEDTAIAAKNVSEQTGSNIASLSSSLCVDIYGLDVLKASIQDADDNFTTFILMSKNRQIEAFDSSKTYITSLIFEIKNIPGAIAKCLNLFAEDGIDLIKLESYIPGGVKSASARFFISFFGHSLSSKISNTLEHLKAFTNHIHIFGSYIADLKRL